MLTHTQLSALHRSHRGERLLSVYVDGSAPDPANQRTWRLHVDRAIKDLRTWLDGSPREERERFEHCVGVVEERLADFGPTVEAPGWVAFIGPDGIIDAQTVPVPVTTQVVWSNGPCVAPYLRALSDARPIIVAVADARKVDLYRCQFGRIDADETVRAHRIPETASSESDTARQGGLHSGSRGTTGHDAAQQSLLENRDRMLDDAAERAVAAARPNGWILLGGIPRVVAALDDVLSKHAPIRVARLDHLDVHASEATIAEAARACATEIRETEDQQCITEIAGRAESGGLGTLGDVATKNALKAESVHRLFLTRRYLDEHAPDAEDAVRRAFDQNAAVEEVTGCAAELLDAQGGIGAELRFHAPGTGDDGPTQRIKQTRAARPKHRHRAPTE